MKGREVILIGVEAEKSPLVDGKLHDWEVSRLISQPTIDLGNFAGSRDAGVRSSRDLGMLEGEEDEQGSEQQGFFPA
jgi:hypothetical protein